MSYIIKSSEPLIRVKLTEIGRQRLATGQLTFSKWAAGDSEIDYGYMSPNLPGVNEMILRPKDEQPNLKYYLKKNDGSIKSDLTASNLKVLGITVNNQATPRGFFNTAGNPTAGWTIQTSTTYAKATGLVPCSSINGSDTIDLGVTNFTSCDFVLFIVTNPVLGTLPTSSLAYLPVPYLWFKIKSCAGTQVTLDRNLPDLSALGTCTNSPTIQFIVYPGCTDPINTYYGSACTSSYWNTGTLTFESSCDVSVADVPVWNQNNVWCEDMLGTQTGEAGHRYYGSIDYIGEKQYLGFPCDCNGTNGASALNCDVPGQSSSDFFTKGIGIIHYTNNTISNFYGEFFYIDATQNKILTLDVPTVMWHRRAWGGSGTGTAIGMRFISDSTLKTLTNTDIQYYDLIEDSTYINGTPIVVGRIYPQLKVIAISDEELLATMSYKSNRNWTLPPLKASLSSPGANPGVLNPGEIMYITYDIRPTLGLQASLPCQYYTKIVNTSPSPRDVSFTIEDLGLLPYMREIETSWDGLGFYGHQFVVLAQKVSTTGTTGCRPDPTMWVEMIWTDPSGGTLSPTEIEDQNPATNDFYITDARYNSGTIYDIGTTLGVPNIGQTDILNFGDERFFYGNIDTYIGAKIFKTVFNINVGRGQFVTTTNPSYGTTSGGILNLSEIAIYDSYGSLVIIGKISTPIPLGAGTTANIEMTLDF